MRCIGIILLMTNICFFLKLKKKSSVFYTLEPPLDKYLIKKPLILGLMEAGQQKKLSFEKYEIIFHKNKYSIDSICYKMIDKIVTMKHTTTNNNNQKQDKIKINDNLSTVAETMPIQQFGGSSSDEDNNNDDDDLQPYSFNSSSIYHSLI